MSKQRSEGHKGPGTRHTPGPWGASHYSASQASEFGGEPGWMVTHPGREVVRARLEARDFPITSMKICDVIHGHYIDEDTAAANARLIAAAPELLTSLKALANYWDNDPYGCVVCGARTTTEDDDNKSNLKHSDDCVMAKARAAITKATTP